jgi:hypothetical protein
MINSLLLFARAEWICRVILDWPEYLVYTYSTTYEERLIMTLRSKSSLEEAFFHKRDVDLIAEFRKKETQQTRKKMLSELSGITNEEVLQQLIAQDIHAEMLAAFLLIPILEVVWADGEVQPEERNVVLHAMEEAGIQKASVAHRLTEQWLERRPEPKLMELWTDYTREMMGHLTPESQECIKQTVMGHARAVAEACGGFLGFGRISNEEQKVLSALEEAFKIPNPSILPSGSDIGV